ncbi:hypothetical protein M9H77_30822 [Catharanthus roseus]|uniref:Uncharacterized protein n=1 Tax=Catharanthus roseus TaxID=4058 RepID=A0ACB9ZYB2_CATRO|nr:hypothetical protein M9H77_30822 [Catharanthus roseus]
MTRLIGGRNMLAILRSGISGDCTLGMALSWQLRIYHPLGMSALYGIGISHECTLKIQQIVILIASFAKKVQTIIRRCMVSIGGTLGCTPSQHDFQQTFPVQPSRRHPREPVPDRGARGVKRGARRLPGGFWSYQSRHPSGLGFSSFQGPPPPSTGSSSFQVPPPPGTRSSSFEAPPPPGMVSSSTPHMPISTPSSSDSDEHDDEQTDVVIPA